MAVLRLIRECDLFRKLPNEHNEADAPDHMPSVAFRVLSVVLISVLGLYETWTFLTPVRKQKFDLDMGETSVGHSLHNKMRSMVEGHPDLPADAVIPLLVSPGAPKKMRVLLDVTIHGFPCIDLSLDYQDVMGTRAVDVRTTIFKQRLHKDGTPVDAEHLANDPKHTSPGGPSQAGAGGNGTNSTKACGDCYGALPDGECCNSCSDVLYAYRLKRWALPRIENIEQCKNDGTAKSAYQPPQIMHLNDYNSEDYIPKFTKLSSLSWDPKEPRITTPFRLGAGFNWSSSNIFSSPTKKTFNDMFSKQSSPFLLNFSGRSFDDDYDNDGFEDDLDFEMGIKDKSEKNASGKVLKWPSCVQRNVIIHGYDIGEALMIDLKRHGAKTGCWNNDCTETDKFACDTMDLCAEMCGKVDACHWWTWGDEDMVKKCWIRTGKHGREKRYGFSSGAKGCAPNSTESNKTETKDSGPVNTTFNTQPRRMMSLEDLPELPDEDEVRRFPTREDEHRSAPNKTRRLMGFEDDFGSLGSRSFGGSFGGGGLSQMNFGPNPHMPIFGYGFNSKENEARKEQKGESCRMYGYFDTNKVPGNFHIGTHGTMAPSYLSYFDEPAPMEQNMRHNINHMAFVDVITNKTLAEKQPLDGFESPKAFTFQYYITISPATVVERSGHRREGYQYRSGSFVTNELIGPAVFFRFDIDPIRVTHFTETVSVTTWMTNMCAVIGGCIAFSSILLQMVESVRNAECS